MKSILATGMAIGMFASTQLFANILPPNDLHLEDDLNFLTNVSKEQFNEIIDQAEKIYKPLIKEVHGATLSFSRNWTSSTVNASASQFFGTWQVNMYGGLARRPEVTPDGFALVVGRKMNSMNADIPIERALLNFRELFSSFSGFINAVGKEQNLARTTQLFNRGLQGQKDISASLRVRFLLFENFVDPIAFGGVQTVRLKNGFGGIVESDDR